MPGNILIIDDEEQLRKLLSRIIGLEGYKVEEAGTLKIGLEMLKRKEIDVILCDVKLPDGNGVDFIRDVKKNYPLLEIILLTAYGNIPDGVQAMKNGAFDYITKGNDNDRIIPLLYQAMDKVVAQRKSAPERKFLQTPFTPIVSVQGNHLLLSIVARLRRTYWKANCLDIRPVHILAQTGIKKDYSNSRMREPCSLMKLVSSN